LRRFLATAILLVGLTLPAALPAQGPDPATAKATTVAILYFDYDGKDEELSYLRKGLTQMLVADLSDVDGIRLVERVELEAVLKELELNRSPKIDRASANAVGKLLGARHLVLGNYFQLYGTLQVNARVVEVETGTVRAVGARRKATEFLELEAELAGKLRERLTAIAKDSASPGTTPRGRKARQARKRPRRMSSTVAARYGRALDAIDRGNKGEARVLLARVVDETPDFGLAAADLASLGR